MDKTSMIIAAIFLLFGLAGFIALMVLISKEDEQGSVTENKSKLAALSCTVVGFVLLLLFLVSNLEIMIPFHAWLERQLVPALARADGLDPRIDRTPGEANAALFT